jgi:hypothetical protein
MGAPVWVSGRATRGATMHSTLALFLVVALVAFAVTMHQAFKQSR